MPYILIGFFAIFSMAYFCFRALFIVLRRLFFGDYKTARHPERSMEDAIAAWKAYEYRSPQCAAWAMDEAVDWAASCVAPTKKEAYQALHSMLRAYSK